MTEMILGGNFHEKRCCEWSDMHSGTPDWFWDIIIVILGGGGISKSDPRGDSKNSISDSCDGTTPGVMQRVKSSQILKSQAPNREDSS